MRDPAPDAMGRGELNLRRVELQLLRVQRRMNKSSNSCSEGGALGKLLVVKVRKGNRSIGARVQGTTLIHTDQSDDR